MYEMKNLQDEIVEKTAEKISEAIKDDFKEMTMPTAKSIGKNMGLLIDGIFGWAGTWGEIQKIKQNQYIKEFKEDLKTRLDNIDSDKIIEPKANIVGPALETAKYYYEEEYYKEMFTKLIASNCNKDKSNDVHPAFIEIIKQLSPLDAKVLNMFRYNSTYPTAELEVVNNDSTITPYRYILCDFKNKNEKFDINEELNLLTAIDNLIRLGIVIKNKSIIELKYDYNNFKNHTFYKIVDKEKDTNSRIQILNSRIELTDIGRKFLNICIM